MLIGGLHKVSLINYPGKISAVVFTQGCVFRCPYCHNPELVNPKLFVKPIPEDEVLNFLEKRKGKLDAVVITGGEPTIQKDLPEFIKKIKAMGFLVKLDTNGVNPEMLAGLLSEKLLDYVAMDLKAPLEKYEKIVKAKAALADIERSIKLIMSSAVDYEFRTTVVKDFLSKKDILKIGEMIKGAKRYVLQKFVPSKTLDRKFMKASTYSDEELEELRAELDRHISRVSVR
jgi:pyruvate formate lyase activating enzyme